MVMSAGVELEENHKTKKGEKADSVAWLAMSGCLCSRLQ